MRLHKITIQNFKAFKSTETVDFEGKNILICGTNGSGKSSLFFALHVFLQSSLPGKTIAKYFVKHGDPHSEETLLNIYANPTPLTYLLRIEVMKKNLTGREVYEMSPALSEGAKSYTDNFIQQSDYASDFISHRLLINFYNFRNSQDANVWSLFETEVFPYWNDDQSGKNLSEWLKELDKKFTALRNESVVIIEGATQERRRRYNRTSAEYSAFQKEITEFNSAFIGLYNLIKDGINVILNNFLENEKLDVWLHYKTPIDTDTIYEWEWNKPELLVKVNLNGNPIPKPHIFLNEARLTALALAIRLAMFDKKFKGVNGQDPLKLLVLDDLLVSLDMDFRMRLVKYLQNAKSFKDYQLIILTHDKGLFEVLKLTLAENSKEWKWFNFFENNEFPIEDPSLYKNPLVVEEKDYLVLAEEYLRGEKQENGKRTPIPKDYELSALYLRKKAEQILKRFYDPKMEQIFRFRILKDLSSAISGAHIEYLKYVHSKLESILSHSTVDEAQIDELKKLKFDRNGLSGEQIAEKGRLESFNKELLDFAKQYYSNQSNYKKQKNELETLSKELNRLRSIVMNPGAHDDESPQFELELRGAIEKIKEYEEKIIRIKN